MNRTIIYHGCGFILDIIANFLISEQMDGREPNTLKS